MLFPPQVRSSARQPLFPEFQQTSSSPTIARSHTSTSLSAHPVAALFTSLPSPPISPALRSFLLSDVPPPSALLIGWTALSLAIYCLRRGVLHGIGPAEVVRRHLTLDPGWPPGWRGRLGYSTALLSWIGVFGPLYPLLEIALRPFGLAAFWYYYPKANGAGLLVEEVATVDEGDATTQLHNVKQKSSTARGGRQVFRLDWHRFSVNVGPPGRPFPRGGGISRHPPSIVLHRPHVDLPHMGVRHWPWKQHSAFMGIVDGENL